MAPKGSKHDPSDPSCSKGGGGTKRAKTRGLSAEQKQRSADAEAAFQSVEDLKNWPRVLVSMLFMADDPESPAMRLRLQANLLRRSVWYGDYSGIDCARHAVLMFIEDGLEAIGFEQANVTFARTCDSGTLQTSVLTQIATEGPFTGMDRSQPCHFMNLKDRLPKVGQDHIAQMLPVANAATKVKAKAHVEVCTWIMDNRSWLFTPNASCHCVVHGGQCQVLPGNIAWHPLPPMKDPDVANPLGAIHINIAGGVCRGWSTVGPGTGEAHDAEVAHAIWLGERVQAFDSGAEGLAFVECTPRYPAYKKLTAVMGHRARVFTIITGPEFIGCDSFAMCFL